MKLFKVQTNNTNYESVRISTSLSGDIAMYQWRDSGLSTKKGQRRTIHGLSIQHLWTIHAPSTHH